MIRTKHFGGAALVSLSIALGACGSDSDSDKPASGGLAKTALVKKVNAICTKAQADAQAIQPPASFEDAEVAAAYFNKVAPITHQETEDLAALEPAADVKAGYATFIAAQREADELLQTITRKANAKDASGVDDLNKVPAAAKKTANAATALGATSCAS